ncbi:MAG: flavodoxin domain-containing protein [Promethearchaeota archaeon]
MYKSIIFYASRSGNTEIMAKAIANGLKEARFNVLLIKIRMTPDGRAVGHIDWIGRLTEVDAIVLGSPTYNQDVFSPMKDFLREMGKTNLKSKVGAAFGSHGGTGEAPRMIHDTMKDFFGMVMVTPALRLIGKASGNSLKECRDFGKTIAKGINIAKKEN